MDSDLIPVRALNHVSYCRRLYYLEYVESVMPINEHVEDGIFQHRRVDDPKLENRTRKEATCLHTRSVAISSTRLGITAKLDLVEERNGDVYPVEYKRSGPRGENAPAYWENDAIQLCAQGLLLEEEFDRPVSHGILYYNSQKKRVEVLLDGVHPALPKVRRTNRSPRPPNRSIRCTRCGDCDVMRAKRTGI